LSDGGLVRVTEGSTQFYVPAGFTEEGPGARKGDVFYNRQMEFGRDVSVLFGRSCFRPGWRVLDGLAASGARGLRLARECGVDAHYVLNDRDPSAADLIRRNADANDLADVEVERRDLRALLHEDSFDYIDIDPFGSPVQFVDAAVQGCRNRGIVALTATDTAPLCGTYPRTSLRRYGALSARSPFSHETGLRILIGYAVRQAAKHDRGCEPLLCFSADHYLRCHLRIVNGATRANAALERLGYASFDRETLERGVAARRLRDADAGPLWSGPLHSEEVLASMRVDDSLGTARRCGKMLDLWREEAASPPLFFKVDELAKRTKHAPPKLTDLIERVRAEGHAASRTHFDPKGIKTDMGVQELLGTLRLMP
jgi:tRNA (guanine26-N2/guanine27-N2)-dimethyltransferase